MESLVTTSGLRFGLLPQRERRVAPTLFMFSASAQESLVHPSFSGTASVLAGRGFCCVSLDLPAHGLERRPGEAEGLAGWRQRLGEGEDVIAGFVSRAKAVLDFLVEAGRADGQRIAACGTSRGGFAALHWAANEPRVRCIAALAPVTDLLTLSEFAGMEGHSLTRSLALVNAADRLADRRLWLCIGNDDRRVGTDQTIAFSRRVTQAAVERGETTTNELHVVQGPPSPLGHTVHASAYQEAAAWIAAHLGLDQRSGPGTLWRNKSAAH